MPARTDVLSQRKEALRLRASLERLELQAQLQELRRLRKPANFAVLGARILAAWRAPAWLTTAGALLLARGRGGGRILRALRYAAYGMAAWRTWQMLRDYTPRRGS
ncbi:MAG: hypothetical protein JNM90_04275 [Burkholderiales bacterium]|nr:hypothetical protein [Burkholderiales bacterium]